MIPIFCVVVTSIASPNIALKNIAENCLKAKRDFLVIGDTKSPANFVLQGCEFFSLATQKQLPFRLAAHCPEKHYARKNMGYLLAIKKGYNIIVETDDDNMPKPDFWQPRIQTQRVNLIADTQWVNVYRYFSEENIWPRGFPLELLQLDTSFNFQAPVLKDCPIQQGLADDNPDVDAIYRMTMTLPVTFEKRENIALGKGSWCPFNSQNTTWFKEAFPLMYLPSFCSFRMTDIWRSFVAQRIAWENDWHILFHHATVYQNRNEHQLLKDFEDEIPGYLNNAKIVQVLEDLELKSGQDNIFDNMEKCYKTLLKNRWITHQKELNLLEDWFEDLMVLDFPNSSTII